MCRDLFKSRGEQSFHPAWLAHTLAFLGLEFPKEGSLLPLEGKSCWFMSYYCLQSPISKHPQPRSLSSPQHPSPWSKSLGSSLTSRISPTAKILNYFPGWKVPLPVEGVGGETTQSFRFLPIQNILLLYDSSFWAHLLHSATLSGSSCFIQNPKSQFPCLYSLCADAQAATSLLSGDCLMSPY